MRISVERLRIGLLVGAGLLVLLIAGFLGYARYRLRRGIVNLPGRLGATITKEFNGYTYSQSDGKRTVFTIHASKATQHTDGTFTLRDVNMVLYGHTGGRADHISGNEFEYDTKAEVIRAAGVVHIDLQAPVPEGARTSEAAKHLGPDAGTAEGTGVGGHVIHVTTSGLVYTKKLATAATGEKIDFAFGGFTGHAVGAEYNSDTGHLVLESAVSVSGLDGAGGGGRPVAMAATHGELDRTKNEADFNQARYHSAGQVAEADVAHIHLRSDGTVERIEGEGHVVLEGAGQGRAMSDKAEAMLDAANKPVTVALAGEVRFTDDEAFRQARGESATADLGFDGHGRIDHAVLHGGVKVHERTRVADDANAPWPERTLTAGTLDLQLAADDERSKPMLRLAKAMGAAELISTSTVLASQNSGLPLPVVSARRVGTTTEKLAGALLEAHFVEARGAGANETAELSTVHGAGSTRLEQKTPDGTDEVSSGDTLDVAFREVAGSKGSVEVASAVQKGSVVVERSSPKKVSAIGKTQPGLNSAGLIATDEVEHAVARSASFDADTDRLTLLGAVRMSDAESAVQAERVVIQRGSGDATAEGAVKASYLQPGETEPVHVLAARAELEHDAGRATFHGDPVGKGAGMNPGLARMWQAGAAQPDVSQPGSSQGGSQIEAPVLVFEQAEKRLTARPETAGAIAEVHTVLMSSGPPASGLGSPKPAARDTSAESASQAPRAQVPVRITSSAMVYSDLERRAEFTGGVRLVDRDGEMRAREATVFLTQEGPKLEKETNAAGGGMLGGQVERIVATKGIELTQPGRRATGDRLVYTASDQMFVLTGTAGAPPKVVDAQQGSTTGAMLRFHSGDNSVSVLGSDGEAPPGKVHTETRLDTNATGTRAGMKTGTRVKQ